MPSTKHPAGVRRVSVCPPGGAPARFELAPRPWMAAFLDALRDGRTVRDAARAVGIKAPSVYSARGRHPKFCAEWDAIRPAQSYARKYSADETAPAALSPHWRSRFLANLAETSNVTASAAAAGTDAATAYRTRRANPEFAARWQQAILEGYEHLELEVLCHLRSPAIERKMDIAAALRLLAAHRETAIRLKALASDEDETAVRESLVTFLEDMRQRRLANQAILIEGQRAHEPDDKPAGDADVAG